MMDSTSEPESYEIAVPSINRQIWSYALELRKIYHLIESSAAINSHRARLLAFLGEFDTIDLAINDLSLVCNS